MLLIPQRQSLVAQTAAAIRKGLEDGVWKEYLPGARRLSKSLQVSRPTVQSALKLLAKDGTVEISHGRRIRVRVFAGGRRKAAPRQMVAVITSEPMSEFHSQARRMISETRAQLAEIGFNTEILVCGSASPRSQIRKIVSFLGQNRIACCLLTGVSRAVQQWFSDRDLPALVLGSCNPSVRLPSVDIDYEAVCRHSAGVFLRHGHRRMALVAAKSDLPGMIAGEKGFLDAARKAHERGANAVVLRHNGTTPNICARLEALMNAPQPPTALLVAHPQHALVVLVHLLKRGFDVPGDVSLIARDEDAMFDSLNPPVAHYKYDEVFVRLITRTIRQLVTEKYLNPQSHLISPQFFQGATLREPRARISNGDRGGG